MVTYSIFGVNSFGFESYRHDRISGFFENQLILGSYLLKFLILFLSLIFFNYKTIKNELIFYLILILFGFYLIIATGDRAPFYLLIVYVILFLYQLVFRFKI